MVYAQLRNPDSIIENETHKIIFYFEIQTYHIISARRPDLVMTSQKIEPAEKWT